MVSFSIHECFCKKRLHLIFYSENLRKSYFIFQLAWRWDGGNPVFQVNQSAITSEQQLTAWGKKERSVCGIYFVSTSAPLFFISSFFLTLLCVRDQLSSILTLYPCYSYIHNTLPLIFPFCDILSPVTKSQGNPGSHVSR